MLVKKRKDLNKWRNILYSWIESLNIAKMSVLPKMIYRFTAIPMKIPEKIILKKYIWKDIETSNGQNNFEKEE